MPMLLANMNKCQMSRLTKYGDVGIQAPTLGWKCI